MDLVPIINDLASGADDYEQKRKLLSGHLNSLLLHDFAQLVQLLYRIDVSEKKLKEVLLQNPGQDAGDLLADLVIARQKEKLKAKESFRFPSSESDEERW